MNVERVEHHRIAPPRRRHLLGRRMGERIGAADRERFEGQARIERRAAERLMGARDRRCRLARTPPSRTVARTSRTGSPTVQASLSWPRTADAERTIKLDAAHRRLLGLPAGEHTLDIVGLDPALEEPRRHGQRAPCRRRRRPASMLANQLEENVVADLGAQPRLDAQPARGIASFVWRSPRLRGCSIEASAGRREATTSPTSSDGFNIDNAPGVSAAKARRIIRRQWAGLRVE